MGGLIGSSGKGEAHMLSLQSNHIPLMLKEGRNLLRHVVLTNLFKGGCCFQALKKGRKLSAAAWLIDGDIQT